MLNTLLQSEWLIRMLDKSSKRASQKMLSLFHILDDLLSSPLSSLAFQHTLDDLPNDRLQNYLTAQAQLAGAKLPEVLASQLYFMAMSACQEKLSHRESNALTHARRAAQALIDAQTKHEINWLAIRNYSVVVFAILCAALLGYQLHTPTTTTPSQTISTAQPALPTKLPVHEASPAETAAIYSRLETMKSGDCRLLEAIQLPEQLKSIYIENIIHGHVTTHRDEQVLVNQLLDQVQCNYTPKLMANSR